MIVKDKESPRPTDPMGSAGYEAEKQMAFFLRRAFAETPDVLVFNDITFERNGERAQIDHLVVHRFGFVIVESKSVTGSVEVNEHLEFIRKFGGRRSGMRSPIEQGRLQKQLLQRLLNDAKESLRPKRLLGQVQPEFGDNRFQIFVAISDKGVIERKGSNPPELMKAERAVKEIVDKTESHQQTQGVKGFVKFLTAKGSDAKQMEDHHVIPFTDQEMASIRDFLMNQCVTNLIPPRQNPPPLPVEVSAPKAMAASSNAAQIAAHGVKCDSCSDPDVEILYGRYGYFVHCRRCDAKKTVPQKCEACGSKAKIRKQAECFYRVCETCSTEKLLHTNPTKSEST